MHDDMGITAPSPGGVKQLQAAGSAIDCKIWVVDIENLYWPTLVPNETFTDG